MSFLCRMRRTRGVLLALVLGFATLGPSHSVASQALAGFSDEAERISVTVKPAAEATSPAVALPSVGPETAMPAGVQMRGPWGIGGATLGMQIEYFSGEILEVMVFDRELHGQEVASISAAKMRK